MFVLYGQTELLDAGTPAKWQKYRHFGVLDFAYTARMANLQRTFLVVFVGFFAGFSSSMADAQAPVKDNGRYSDAEKAYVPPAATTKVATDAPRRATLEPVFGRKF